MKKLLLSFSLFCTAVLFLCPKALAAEMEEYQFEELGLQFSIPTNHIVFTKDTQENDPGLLASGLTLEEVQTRMTETDIWLECWDKDLNYSIVIAVRNSPEEDFNLSGDDQFLSDNMNQIALRISDGKTLQGTELYQQSLTKFYKIHLDELLADSVEISNCIQYCYTIFNGKSIMIILRTFEGEASPQSQELLQEITDSMTLYTSTAPAPEAQSPLPFTTPKFPITFLVPVNWKATPDSSTQEDSLTVSFHLTEDPSVFIVYQCVNSYNRLPEEDRKSYSRAEIGSFTPTKEQLSGWWDVPLQDIGIVTYGGREFFRLSTPKLSFTNTAMLFYENGYAHMFILNQPPESKYYKDFETLLSTVVITDEGQPEEPAPNTVTPVDTPYPKAITRNPLDWLKERNSPFLFTAVMAIYALPIYLYRYGCKKASMPPAQARKIAILYGLVGLCALLLAAFFFQYNPWAAIAILPWSCLNYFILCERSSKDRG